MSRQARKTRRSTCIRYQNICFDVKISRFPWSAIEGYRSEQIALGCHEATRLKLGNLFSVVNIIKCSDTDFLLTLDSIRVENRRDSD